MHIPRRCGRLRLAGRLALDESAQSLAHLLAADYSRMVGVLTISYRELRFRVSVARLLSWHLPERALQPRDSIVPQFLRRHLESCQIKYSVIKPQQNSYGNLI